MRHSTKGEEFLPLPSLLVYFFPGQLSSLLKYVLTKVIEYLTFATVTGCLYIFLHEYRATPLCVPVPTQNSEG